MTRRSRSSSRRDRPIAGWAAAAFAVGCGLPPLAGAWTLDLALAGATSIAASCTAVAAVGLLAWGRRAAGRACAIGSVAMLGAGLAIRAGCWSLPDAEGCAGGGLGEVLLAAEDAQGTRQDLRVPEEGTPARVVGRVATGSTTRLAGSDWLGHELGRGGGLRCELEDVTIRGGDGRADARLRGSITIASSSESARLEAGEVIEARGWLLPARAGRNPRPAPPLEGSWPPGGPRAATIATLAIGDGAVRVIEPAPGGIVGALRSAREELRRRVERVARAAGAESSEGPPDPRPALAMTMLLGRGSFDDPETRDHFARSGLSHLVAISGFNFAVLALGSSLVLRACGGPWRVATLAAAILALGYLGIVDDEPSVARAGWIAVAGSLADAAGRRYRAVSLLAGAAIVLLASDPLAIGRPGFQLTFAAVLALRWAATPLGHRWYGRDEDAPATVIDAIVASVRGLVVSSLAVWLVVTPISVVHFGQVSWLGLPLSIPAIPLGGLAIGNGLAVAVAAAIDERLAIPLAHSWIALTGAILWIAELPGRLHVPDLDVGRPGWAWAAILSAAAILWCRSELRPLRKVAVGLLAIGWLPITAAALASGDHRGPEWTMLDVGDGSCHILQSGSRAVVFDAGSLDLPSLGARTAVPALRAAGVSRIEAIIVSHPNLDHFAAVPAIMARFPTGRLIVSPAMLEAATDDASGPCGRLVETARALGVAVEVGAVGRAERMIDAEWTWLHPDAGDRYPGDNDGSQVIQVRWALGDGGFEIVLAGDVETRGVLDLVARSSRVDADLIEMPHHGSWRPAVAAWIETIRPRAVLQSTGPERWRRDRWGEVLAGTIRRVTCVDGAVRARAAVAGRPQRSVLLERWTPRGWEPCGSIPIDGRAGEAAGTLSGVSDAAASPAGVGSHRRSGRGHPRSPRSRATPNRAGPAARSVRCRRQDSGGRLRGHRPAPRDQTTSTTHRGHAASPRPRASTGPSAATIAPTRDHGRQDPRRRPGPDSSRSRTRAGRTKATFPSRAPPWSEATAARRPCGYRAGTREGPRGGSGSYRGRLPRNVTRPGATG